MAPRKKAAAPKVAEKETKQAEAPAETKPADTRKDTAENYDQYWSKR